MVAGGKALVGCVVMLPVDTGWLPAKLAYRLTVGNCLAKLMMPFTMLGMLTVGTATALLAGFAAGRFSGRLSATDCEDRLLDTGV
jgi:hypothetical protein